MNNDNITLVLIIGSVVAAVVVMNIFSTNKYDVQIEKEKRIQIEKQIELEKIKARKEQ